MSIHIIASKTDQYQQGSKVLVARSKLPTCLVAMLERYFIVTKESNDSDLRLFRGITSTKTGQRVRKCGTISYTRMSEILKGKLKSLGYDDSQFSLHSFRSGGASGAANAHVVDRLFKKHGRWRSESAKDGYVEDTEEDRLEVSRQLKI